MHKIYKFCLFSLLLLITSSCGPSFESIEKAVTGQKKTSSDEFLVQKKDPLVLPPEFDVLPVPRSQNSEEVIDENEKIQETISIKKQSTNDDDLFEKDGTVEENILKQIKKN